MAFTGLADRPLRAPVERPQDLPDVAFVIAHAELVGDQTSDPRTSPQRRRKVMRLGALEQHLLQAFELCGVQQRLAAGAPSLAESGRTPLPMLANPTAHALLRRLHAPCCLGLTQTFFDDQPHGLQSSLLQSIKIAPLRLLGSPCRLDEEKPQQVTLYYAGINS